MLHGPPSHDSTRLVLPAVLLSILQMIEIPVVGLLGETRANTMDVAEFLPKVTGIKGWDRQRELSLCSQKKLEEIK